MTHDDAMAFLERVRVVFSDRPFIYNSFLCVMKEFKQQTITADGVVERVKPMFKGHPDLLTGFNMFLPPSHRIAVDNSPPSPHSSRIDDKQSQKFASAYQYITKLKKRVSPDIYKQFMSVLHKYHTTHRSVDLVSTLVTRLLRSHPDLVTEFAMFLPERERTAEASGTHPPPPLPSAVLRNSKRSKHIKAT